MFLGVYRLPRSEMGFPRVRGDVPCFRYLRPGEYPFSPRARGCSQAFKLRSRWRLVFPACAGMFPHPHSRGSADYCFPRVRGDVPVPLSAQHGERAFSPRARGCSEAPGCPGAGILVFPAHAGMFRKHPRLRLLVPRFPRARGDVPCKYVNVFLWFVVVVRVLVPGLGW